MKVYKYIDSKNSNKLELDKYYTPEEIVDKCLEIFFNEIPLNCISEIIEPSAGNGSFSNKLFKLNKPLIAIDIAPEDSSITEQDYLSFDIDYLKGRAIIGNPPFGRSMNLAVKFFNKSVDISDYIGFILPISQLNNPNSLYKFDLIKSVDLGTVKFSDREVKCCFNVYKRPENGTNIKKSNKLKDITIIRQDNKKYKDISEFDIRLCYWGNATAGKILKENEHYSAEYKIVIHNKKLKNKILNVIETINWKEELNTTAMVRIKQWEIINILKREIPEIK